VCEPRGGGKGEAGGDEKQNGTVGVVTVVLFNKNNIMRKTGYS
jgi:hypothetical protein